MTPRLPTHLSYLPLTTLLSRRTLSTTSACLADIGSHRVEALIPQNAQIPEYPYGPSHIYKQSNKGLYGGSRIQFGNNVSDRTEIKTRRSWSPNIISKSLYSVALKKKVEISKATNAARKKSKSNANKIAQNRMRLKRFGALKEGSRSKISGKRGIGINKRQEIVPREETKMATEGWSRPLQEYRRGFFWFVCVLTLPETFRYCTSWKGPVVYGTVWNIPLCFTTHQLGFRIIDMGYYNSTLDSRPYIANISLDIFCRAVSVGLVLNLIYVFYSLCPWP